MVKIKIHRGTSQIGGTITEIYTENTHIFIDFGSELSVDPEESTDQKMTDMIQHAKCDAVLFSHYHGDHIGLMGSIPREDIRGRKIRLGMGLEARKVLIRIYKTLKQDEREGAEERNRREYIHQLLCDRTRWDDFPNKEPFVIGDFTITPIRVDHSAYDAYMFVIEAEGKRIVHTGDFRTHGRLGDRVFDDVKEVLGDNPVDVLIIEGTMMERLDETVRTEEQIEQDILEFISRPENKYAFVVCSSTNMESLASFNNAAYAKYRPFIMNRYVYSQVEGYKKSVGKEDERFRFKAAHAFAPVDKVMNFNGERMTQPEYMRKHGFLMLVGTSDAYKERMAYFKDLDPVLIFSMWNGYIDDKKDTFVPEYGKLVKDWRSNTQLHTSGHATAQDIADMIGTVKPRRGIIPVHTTKKEQFEKLDIEDLKIIPFEDGNEIIL